MSLTDELKKHKKEMEHSLSMMKRGPVPIDTKKLTKKTTKPQGGIFGGPGGLQRQAEVRERLEERGFRQPTKKITTHKESAKENTTNTSKSLEPILTWH